MSQPSEGESKQRHDASPPTALNRFSLIAVLSILWCFVFLLVFSLCLFIFKTQQKKRQKSQPNGDEVTDADVSLYEVSDKMKKREKNKSYKERVNSVYYEWMKDYTPQRKPDRSVCTEVHINEETLV